jgi:hypothetical protein
LENNDYKITLSETLPGIDSQSPLPPDAAITVTVNDKLHSRETLFPLKAFAIPNYFFLGDTLNLVARTTAMGSQPVPLYSFIQLALSNPSDSRQFQNLRQYSLSPDQQNLLAVVYQADAPPLVGITRLMDSPVETKWIYAEPARVNLFKASFGAPVTALTLWDPVGWSADSLSAAFLFTVDDGSRDAKGNPIPKDFLADLEWTDKGWQASAQPVNLTDYRFHAGAALTDVRISGGKIGLFLASDSSTNPVEVDFDLNSK